MPNRSFQARARFLIQVSIALTRAIGNHPLAVLILPAIYFLVRYPPFWNGIDAVVQLVVPACSTNILHYPPLYCFLARIPFWIADYVLQGSSPTIFANQHPSLPDIYLLVCCQHAALCLSLRYFLFSLPTTAFRRGLLTILLASMSSFYSFAHTCGSDALVPVCWFIVFGSGIRLIQPGAVCTTWIVYSAALLLGIGSRHITGALLIWLPALCAMLLVGHWLSPASNFNLTFSDLGRLAALALISGACIFCVEKLIVGVLCEHFQVIPRSSLGATLSDRISSIVVGLSEQGKAKLCARVESLSSDPLVRLAITSQVYRGPYYGGTNDVITDALVARAMHGERLDAERDRIILQSSSCFYRAVPSRLLKASWRDFLRAIFRTSDTTVALAGPNGTLSAAQDALKEPASWHSLRSMPMFDLSTASAMVKMAKSDVFLKKWHRLPILRWCLMFLVICVTRLRRSTLSPAFFLVGLSLLGIGAFSCFSFFACVFYCPRYVLPLMVSVTAAGSVLTSTLSNFGMATGE